MQVLISNKQIVKGIVSYIMRTLSGSILLFTLFGVFASCSTTDIEGSSAYKISEDTKDILKKRFTGYNQEYNNRDAILGITPVLYKSPSDSLRKFSGLSIQKLDQLLAGRFIDPDFSLNNAPTAREFIDFMSAHPQLTAHGIVINPDRQDYRVSIQGLDILDSTAVSPMMKKDFQEFCKDADSLFTSNILYSDWK
jgi:hypothetical protein